MKKLKYTFKIITTLMAAVFIVACSNDDDSIDELVVYSATLNGTNLDEESTDVALNGNIEITFSHTLDQEAFAQAFSFSGPEGEAIYTTSFGNASSKAIISYSDLMPASTYTIAMNQSAVGSNGEALKSGFSRSFTVTTELEETKIPCTTASEDCMQQIEVSEGANFEFYSSFDIISDSDYVWEDIEKVIFVVHGQNRDADEYFRYMTNTVGDLGKLENTLVISPFFKDEASATDDELYWDTNWRTGANSRNSSVSISSFSVLDQIVDYLANMEKFPNLTEIKFAGHSSGAALVQHYTFANTSEATFSNYEFQYVVANNQYFYYPDGRRYDERTGDFYTPADCSGYDFWPYGYETAPSYLEGMTQEDLLQQQIARNTIYLLGAEDTQTEGTLNTTDCAATLLGSNRLERGKNIFNFFETYYPENNQELIEIPNVGHDANAMFSSDEFKSILNRE